MASILQTDEIFVTCTAPGQLQICSVTWR